MFLDAVRAVVLAALEQIGDDPDARFRFFRRLLAVPKTEGGGRCWTQLGAPTGELTGQGRGHVRFE